MDFSFDIFEIEPTINVNIMFIEEKWFAFNHQQIQWHSNHFYNRIETGKHRIALQFRCIGQHNWTTFVALFVMIVTSIRIANCDGAFFLYIFSIFHFSMCFSLAYKTNENEKKKRSTNKQGKLFILFTETCSFIVIICLLCCHSKMNEWKQAKN